MNSSFHLRKYVTPEIIFGRGARHYVGRYAQQFMATKVLLVSDVKVSQTSWFDDVKKSLTEADICFEVFTGVTPNPRVSEVMTGAELYRSGGCNVIVALGGGSPMDCAKGIGMVSSNRMNVTAFEGVDLISSPVPPLIFIPTTAGSSADVSQFCILSDRRALKKIAIVSKAIVPDVALIDPETTISMENYLTACTGVDGLTHAIEAFVSMGSGVLTDSAALEAISLIRNNLAETLRDPENLDLREKIMLGSMKAGLAFSNASLGAVHAMSHSLGGQYDLAHGECNAMLLEHVIAFNFPAAPERFRVVAETLGLDVRGLGDNELKNALMTDVMRFKREVGIADRLTQKGVQYADVTDLSRKAVADACMLTNPRQPSRRDIEVIFEEAM
ncbi:alcohol dehydrogenase-like regulatory protein ErcA [Pelobacter seleniigenes]|uniref:alcohol dehydrogenase-like regulatory protein ErcA n=1 Tax=Pelobacter seleniigenes TaxID=407188 RepID=UPI0004A71123|nr:alcohol dehydrogenase-like regulatory protein ErcA [Pelobacter seleniigenes]